MAVDLADLITRLQPKLNVPGAARPMFDFTDDDPWIDSLASGFWNSKARGFYVNYRVNVDGDAIVNIVDSTVDLPPEDVEVLIVQCALTSIENLMLSMFSTTRDKSGPTETERQRSSTLLKALQADRRAELEDIRKQIVFGNGATTARVIDAVLVRSNAFFAGFPTFVN